ncbi:MAG: 23S rRNA (pseudouridine(1915)-N(3))-methyltransferase RlmH [Muribaculaceae bacterium]|nr:23S rRNA (pseudouridine(1915)-N(3))-methyltransferase RlmH [Muribaculaceae bacterium]
MKIRLINMGSVRDRSLKGLIDEYAAKIGHYWPFSITDLQDVKLPRGVRDPQQQKVLEGERFLSKIEPGDFVILFDERGRQYTSREFAAFIQRKAVELPRNLIFIVGGPYGFSQAMYDRADMLLSLSKMTFPHELVRLFVVEQLYRAGTISRDEPYHHD